MIPAGTERLPTNATHLGPARPTTTATLSRWRHRPTAATTSTALPPAWLAGSTRARTRSPPPPRSPRRRRRGPLSRTLRTRKFARTPRRRARSRLRRQPSRASTPAIEQSHPHPRSRSAPGRGRCRRRDTPIRAAEEAPRRGFQITAAEKTNEGFSGTRRRGGKVHESTTTEEDGTEGTRPIHAGDGGGPRRPCAGATSTEEDGTEENGTEEDGTGETLTRASATVLPTVLYPTTLTAWTRTTTAWTHRTRHRRVRRRCRCSRQRARRLPWTLAKTQLCHQTQLCPRPSFRGRTIFSSPGSRPRSLMRSGRRCRT
jgi:hypothetical protein